MISGTDLSSIFLTGRWICPIPPDNGFLAAVRFTLVFQAQTAVLLLGSASLKRHIVASKYG